MTSVVASTQQTHQGALTNLTAMQLQQSPYRTCRQHSILLYVVCKFPCPALVYFSTALVVAVLSLTWRVLLKMHTFLQVLPADSILPYERLSAALVCGHPHSHLECAPESAHLPTSSTHTS